MFSSVRFSLFLSFMAFTFTQSASAYFCGSPADVGGLTYSSQHVDIVTKKKGEFSLEFDVVNYRCSFYRGAYSWDPTQPLEAVSRVTNEGESYLMNVVKGEARLVVGRNEVLQVQPITNDVQQTVIFKLNTKDVFAKSNYVRVRFTQKMTFEMVQGESVYRPMPVSGPEFYLDLRLSEVQ